MSELGDITRIGRTKCLLKFPVRYRLHCMVQKDLGRKGVYCKRSICRTEIEISKLSKSLENNRKESEESGTYSGSI